MTSDRCWRAMLDLSFSKVSFLTPNRRLESNPALIHSALGLPHVAIC